MAGGVGGDGVAAFEDAEGVALFKLEAETIEAVALDAEETFGADGEFVIAALEAAVQAGDFGAEIDRQEAKVLRGVTAAAVLDTSAKAEFEASGEVVAAAAVLRDLVAKIE